MNTLKKYPKQIPVYITRSTLAYTSTHLSRHKFLVAPTITIEILSEYIRRLLKLSSSAPIFLFVNNILQKSDTIIADIYSDHKTFDGEIHMTYSTDNIINSLNLYRLQF
jgi:hypothetical protein